MSENKSSLYSNFFLIEKYEFYSGLNFILISLWDVLALEKQLGFI